MDILGIFSFGVENGLGVVEDQEDIPGGKERSQRSQVLGVLDSRTDYFGEAGEEIGMRACELVTVDESAVIAKPFLDAIVMKNRKGYRRFPNPPRTDNSGGFEVLSKTNDFLD